MRFNGVVMVGVAVTFGVLAVGHSWLIRPADAGLAATYDQPGRFDLADRAYDQTIILAGPTPEILKNQGYLPMPRGNFAAAREKLEKVQSLDPENRSTRANLDLLAEIGT